MRETNQFTFDTRKNMANQLTKKNIKNVFKIPVEVEAGKLLGRRVP